MTNNERERHKEQDDSHDEDLQNDDIIASAFRKSMIVLAIGTIPIVAYFFVSNFNRTKEEASEVAVTLPENREVQEQPIPVIPLVEVARSVGIDFVHQSGRSGQKLLPETMGSGVAVLDYNNDGHQDLFFVNSRNWPWDESQTDPSPCKLYAGDGNFSFTDVTESAGLDVTLYGMGVAVGDLDNDGDCDLFLSAVGNNQLFRNDDGVFVNITNDAGVGGANDAWSTSSGFFDYDNDGLVDLFVCNYVAWSKEKDLSQNFTLDGEGRAYGPPRAFSGTFSYLYHNEGDGSFRDVSDKSGIQIRNENTDAPLGKAMGLAPVDVNEDGWIDFIVSNDTVRNYLYQNNKDGTFAEIGRLAGIAFDRSTGNARGAMGIDTAKFRDDGTLAVGIGNFANEASALYMSRPGRSQFIDAAMHTGFGPPTRQALTFGLCFSDLDLDGRLDLVSANGHLEEDIAKTQSTQRYKQPPQVFWNAGRGAKSELVLVDAECVGKSFCQPIVGRGVAYGDFDEDGDADFVISTSHSPVRVFRNDQNLGNHWLRIELQGKLCNRDAIGAVVEIQLGDRTLSRTVMPTKSYLSQCERAVTFGLGSNSEIPSVLVRWPGGEQETFAIEKIDRIHRLVQGKSNRGVGFQPANSDD